jgi:magnesium chelatase subunit D
MMQSMMSSTQSTVLQQTANVNVDVEDWHVRWDAQWQLATTAAALLAVDPIGLGGAVLRAPAGAVRDQWLVPLREFMQTNIVKRVPSNIADARLLGGLDLAATLALGKPVADRGLLAECDGGIAIFPMAERMSPSMAAKLSSVLDTGEVAVERDGFQLRHRTAFVSVLLDEGIEADESASAALADRLAFHFDFADFPERLLPGANDVAMMEFDVQITPAGINRARAALSSIAVSDDIAQALTSTALGLGIDSMRAPLFALRAARAIAALNNHRSVTGEDAELAAQLVLAPRAMHMPSQTAQDETLPEPPTPQAPETSSREEQDASDEQQTMDERPLEDIVLAATAAAIPDKLLQRLITQSASGMRYRQSAGRAGAQHQSAKRGRIVGTARGDIRSGARLNVLATLRAAAPWQRLRKAGHKETDSRLVIWRDDFRVNRFQERAETTTIFVVDASGSAALHRLAEAKGAVELLLADCYIRRDRVAVIAFRGKSAEILLPPTRSLVRAKRSLASLPGGGGTPLACGVDAARMLAEGLARHGDSVVVVMLTDGRANVTRAGAGDRAVAESEALSAARSLRSGGARMLLVDTSPQANPRAAALAGAMGATYLPLPHAGARTLHSAVQSAVSANVPMTSAQR